MGSGSSKSSNVRITRVAEYRPTESPTDKGGSASAVNSHLLKYNVDNKEDVKSTTEETVLVEPSSSEKTTSTKQISKCSMNLNDGCFDGNRDIISIHKSRPVKSVLPPIHYVEKNEGGITVEDVESNSGLISKTSSTVIKETDRGDEGIDTFHSIHTSVPENRWRPEDHPLPIAFPGRLSLPASDLAIEIAPGKLAPINNGKQKLGVSGRALIDELQHQGIITQEAAQYADSERTTIIGELTHLGLLQDHEGEQDNNTVIYDETERRKIPARLSKLPQKDISSFPNPDGKRMKIRTRSYGIGCGFQLNEDVVSNALQRACVRERKVSKSAERQERETRELSDKISNVDLL